MDLFRSMFGNIRLKIVSADPAGTISQLIQSNIKLESVSVIDPLTIEFVARRQDYKKIKQVSDVHGYQLRIVRLEGIYWICKKILQRPVLILGILLLLGMVVYLPGRIFFVQVEGNKTIPSRLILDKASDCGIGFGSARREVRSEKMKNALLESVPQLQWAGINTSGCVATITVKEKTLTDNQKTDIAGVTSIVASRDGIIQKCTVLKGNPLCSVGQAVRAGQVLVSGYTDCGLSISASQSDAEIYALTDRYVKIISPVKTHSRGEIIRTEKKYSVQIGKNLINLFNNSGISDATCVKIYDKQELTLPGGFTLPISLITETCIFYDESDSVEIIESDFEWVSDYSKSYLDSLMIAGQVIHAKEVGQLLEDAYIFEADCSCYEMIGQVKKEEIIQ